MKRVMNKGMKRRAGSYGLWRLGGCCCWLLGMRRGERRRRKRLCANLRLWTTNVSVDLAPSVFGTFAVRGGGPCFFTTGAAGATGAAAAAAAAAGAVTVAGLGGTTAGLGGLGGGPLMTYAAKKKNFFFFTTPCHQHVSRVRSEKQTPLCHRFL